VTQPNNLRWRPHTERPTGSETALIAIRPIEEESGQPEARLLAELHIWSRNDDQWFSERGGMPIRHPVFWWLPETDVLQSLLP
jgi:hypothetical protein